MAPSEAAEASSLAEHLGLAHQVVETYELEDPRYAQNDSNRCAWCKTHLMDALEPLAAERDAVVLLGVNVDDLGDHRPGQAVAAERGARFPLVEAGLTKEMVREDSRVSGSPPPRSRRVRAWPRASYGTPVTLGTLRSVAEAEAAIRALGFGELRVRHHGPVALVELPADHLAEALERRGEIVAACRDAGYAFASLDLEGLGWGRLNRLLG